MLPRHIRLHNIYYWVNWVIGQPDTSTASRDYALDHLERLLPQLDYPQESP